MMTRKYMFISDVHGSLPALEAALALYEQQHCDLLFLLGDVLNYGPRNPLPEGLNARGVADRLNAMADQVVAVRGNCDSEVDQMLLHFPIMDTCTQLVHEGHRILLTHGHVWGTEHQPQGHFHAVCQGHTHLWQLEKKQGKVLVNTGSISLPKGGCPPTVAILHDLTFSLLTLQGQLLAQQTMEEA